MKQAQRAWHRPFLSALRKGGCIEDASKAAGIDSDTYYKFREKNPEFRAEVEKALDEAIDRLEAIAIRRAGKHSDKLAEFLLTRRHPRYKVDPQQGAGGQQVNVNITLEDQKKGEP